MAITGTGFTGATRVTIGGLAATSLVVVNDSYITATTPSGAAGAASVVVATSSGSNLANTLFAYGKAAHLVALIGSAMALMPDARAPLRF